MSKVIPLILFLIGCFLLWLLYLNRSSPRIQEATGVIAAVIIAALLFVMKGELLQKTIHSVYFINNKDQIPLFFIGTPVLGQRYGFQSVIFGNYQKRMSDQNKKTSFDLPSGKKPLVDFQAIAILDHICRWYPSWYAEPEIKKLPGASTFRSVEIERVENDLVEYPKDSLPDSLKENMFFHDFTGFTTLALPKNTEIYYTCDKNKPSCEYRFYKRFNFDIRIKIHPYLPIPSLGSVGDYMHLTTNIADELAIKSEHARDYTTMALLVTCEAKFHPIRAGNPSVARYKRWVKVLFDDLYNAFDWSVCDSEMRDYQQTLSTQKIINKLK